MFMRVTRRLRVKTSWDVCTSITSGCASQRVHERERLFLLHNRTDVWCGIARGDRADESCHVCVCDEACDGWAWMCDTVWHSVIHCDTVHSECVIHCDTYCDEACDGCTVMRHVMGAQWLCDTQWHILWYVGVTPSSTSRSQSISRSLRLSPPRFRLSHCCCTYTHVRMEHIHIMYIMSVSVYIYVSTYICSKNI